MKCGLVLEGGGMRGIYSVGVLDYLMQQRFLPDYLIGVSAGACNAVSYLSGQDGRGYRVIINYIGDKRYVGLKNWFKTGSIFGMDFIFDEIPHRLDLFDYGALRSCPCEMVVGVTDVISGKPAYYSKDALDPESMVLRASSSIPVFPPIVEIDGRPYLDGGTSDPIPFQKALDDGCDFLIVILTQDRSYQKPPEKFQAVYRRRLRDYPEMIRTLDTRHTVYNEQRRRLFELEQQGTAVVIAPSSPPGISRFEKSRESLDRVYQMGKQDAAASFALIQERMKENV